MPPMVSYEDFTSMGLYLHPVYMQNTRSQRTIPKAD